MNERTGRNEISTQVINPDTIPSLPRRLAGLSIGTVQWPGQQVRLHIQTREGTLTEAERTEAEALLSTLTIALSGEASLELEGRVYPGPEAKDVLVLKIIRGLAGASKASDVEATAKMAMYGDAIDDIPAWAIDKAVKRWAKGLCPYSIEEKPDYKWPPAPAVLRKMALFDMEEHSRNIAKLKALLECIPLKRAMDPEPLPVAVGDRSLPTLRRM